MSGAKLRAVMDTAGRHLMAELEGCAAQPLNDPTRLRRHMLASMRVIGATVVGEAFHAYRPQGVSGVLLIAESHMSVHTWPEAGYVAVDVYTCGDIDPTPAIAAFADMVGAKHCRVREVSRGVLGRAPQMLPPAG